jgi:hypothetical protein
VRPKFDLELTHVGPKPVVAVEGISELIQSALDGHKVRGCYL